MNRKLEDIAGKHGFLDALSKQKVLFLPENIFDDETQNLRDTQDIIDVTQNFKENGLNLATAYDLGLKIKIKSRNNDELWLGVIWVIESAILPTLTGLFVAYLGIGSPKRKSKLHLEMLVQKNDSTSSIKFDGDAEDFIKIMNELSNPDE